MASPRCGLTTGIDPLRADRREPARPPIEAALQTGGSQPCHSAGPLGRHDLPADHRVEAVLGVPNSGPEIESLLRRRRFATKHRGCLGRRPSSRRVHSDNRHTRLSARSLPHIAGSLALICAGTDGQSASASRQLCAPGRRAVRFTACSIARAAYRRFEDAFGDLRLRVIGVTFSDRPDLECGQFGDHPGPSQWHSRPRSRLPFRTRRGSAWIRLCLSCCPARWPTCGSGHRARARGVVPASGCGARPSRRLDVPSRHRVGRTLRLAYERGRSGAGISSSASSLRAPLRRCA